MIKILNEKFRDASYGLRVGKEMKKRGEKTRNPEHFIFNKIMQCK